MTKATDQPSHPPAKASAERGEAVRAKLLDAAVELITELGWNAVTTRRLAERAGIRSGLVHYHFESLQSLLRHAAMAETTRAFDDPRAQLDDADVPDQPEALLSLLDVFDGTDRTSLLLVEAYLAAARDPVLREQMSEVVEGFRGALSDALARAGTRSPGAKALVILAALDGLVLQKGLDPELPTDEATALLREFIHPGKDGTHL